MLEHPFAARPCSKIPVLLVDDDDCLRSTLAWSLREDGHEILEYRAADQVPPFSTLQAVSVVITDYEMPRIDGISFADAFHEVRPDVPILLVTGHASPWVLKAVAVRDFLRLLLKPVDYDVLHEAIHSARALVKSSLPALAHGG